MLVYYCVGQLLIEKIGHLLGAVDCVGHVEELAVILFGVNT